MQYSTWQVAVDVTNSILTFSSGSNNPIQAFVTFKIALEIIGEAEKYQIQLISQEQNIKSEAKWVVYFAIHFNNPRDIFKFIKDIE